MPVHMGVRCEVCGKLHFIATSRSIQFIRSAEGMYRLNCTPPRRQVREFRKEGMHPYRVSDEAFGRGYATEGEYELVPGIERKTADDQKEGLTQQGHKIIKS